MFRYYCAVGIALSLVFTAGCGDDGNGGGASVDPPSWVMGFHPGGTEVGLMYGGQTRPTEYNIYESPDGGTYSLLATVPGSQPVYVTGYTGTDDRWYYVTAVQDGVESAPSEVVRAQPSITTHTMTIVSPSDGQTGVSRTPTISWDPVSGAESYYVTVKASDGVTMVWAVSVLAPASSVEYGTAMSPPEEIVLVPPVEYPLLADTDYCIFIIAVNMLNWGFNSGGMFHFTTGP